MLTLDADKLRASLKQHEGYRKFPYVDSSEHHFITIGVGRNLSTRGLSGDEIDYLLNNDIVTAIDSLCAAFPWLEKLPSLNDVRKRAFAEISFNLGIPALQGFYQALEAAQKEDWSACALAFKNSRWDLQVGHRAKDLEDMIETGLDPKFLS